MSGMTMTSSDLDCDDVGEGSMTEPATDCDDSNPSAYPGAGETIGDGIDQDCDGGDICYIDADFDGFREASGSLTGGSAGRRRSHLGSRIRKILTTNT